MPRSGQVSRALVSRHHRPLPLCPGVGLLRGRSAIHTPNTCMSRHGLSSRWGKGGTGTGKPHAPTDKTPKDRTEASKPKNHHHRHWWQPAIPFRFSNFPGAYCAPGIQHDRNRSNTLSFDSQGPAGGGGQDKVGKTPSTQDSERTAMEKATGQEQSPLMGRGKRDSAPQSLSQHTPHDAETLDRAPRCFGPG